MKRIFVTAASAALLLGASFAAAAQTRTPTPVPVKPAAPQTTPVTTVAVPDTRIALINTAEFGDSKTGIMRYVNAVRSVQGEFQVKNTELVNIQNQIKALAAEISKLAGASVVDPKTIQAKQDEGERLERDLKYKKDQAQSDFDKRYKAVVGPISEDIGKAIDQFASQNRITMVLDVSKLEPALLTVNPAMDVTRAFIADYNARHP